jgi:hypothetical protein
MGSSAAKCDLPHSIFTVAARAGTVSSVMRAIVIVRNSVFRTASSFRRTRRRASSVIGSWQISRDVTVEAAG